MTKPEYSLTSKEVEQILAHAGAFGQGTGAYGQGMETRNLAILDLLVALGLRCSEVVALTPASIIETGNSSVLRVVGKGKHTRDLPLSPALDTTPVADGPQQAQAQRVRREGGLVLEPERPPSRPLDGLQNRPSGRKGSQHQEPGPGS